MGTTEQTDSVGAMMARLRWDKATAEDRLEKGRQLTAGRKKAARKRARASLNQAQSSKGKHTK